MQYPFVIFALPRSRTAWLSKWLSYDNFTVGHDLAPLADTCQGFLDSLYPMAGTVETGAQDAYGLLKQAMPNAKFIVIRRPVVEVVARLDRMGMSGMSDEMQRRDAVLEHLGTMIPSIPYAALNDARVCADLFEYLLGVPFDWKWWQQLQAENVQIDLADQMIMLSDRRDQIETLKREMASLSDTDAQFYRIGWEPFASAWEDAKVLTAAHSVEVNAGVRKGHPFKLNTDLIGRMEATGLFRVMSARINGRLVGYITWSFTEDVESEGVLVAEQGAWFVDPDAPSGIGRKLLDKSISEFKKLHIYSLLLHHQLNGRGAKLGTLFQRMGAMELQHRYSLWLGD